MVTTEAHVPTSHGSRYLQQLCKHWAHKLEVAFTPEHGKVKLPDGAVADMRAAADALEVRLTAPDTEILERMKGVVARHLDRFAFREAPLPFEWRDGV
ncbi:DUF2218 domain-containing protein [Ancylobacter sp. VNQ12]|uniref:DUF2218 domain-containing protein n=1 Tax=Ancylobacter sp. VNQ12 TaxID=3400920 RepID=UPI003C040D1E